MFWKDFLYICWSWLPALEHGKIEENTVNSGIFDGWGDKGIGSIVEHDVFDRFLWRQKCKVPCKNMETHSKNTGFGGLSRRRCLAIWNSAAWRASKGGKSENSWKFHSLGSCHGGEKWKFPSLGSPHGGEKWKFPSLGSPHVGENWKFPSLGEPPRGGKVKIP